MGFQMKTKKSAPNSDINVTPLIDVVLVLLIIFMVITPRVVHEMAANLPTKTQPRNNPPDASTQLIVAAYDNGEIALNASVMEMGALHTELRARLRGREKKVVFLDAHPELDYGRVILVMDMIRDDGAERVGMARLKAEGPSRTARAQPVPEATAEAGTEDAEAP